MKPITRFRRLRERRLLFHALPIILAVLVSGLIQSAAIAGEKPVSPISVLSSEVLSSQGSTRATAYGMSNKIITHGDKIFVSWLDHVADIRIKTFDTTNNTWSKTVWLGVGKDNHSGPALTMDSQGYLHVVFGPHHGPFQYRRSVKPYDAGEWTPEEQFGSKETYPSLICGPDDTLYCACRSNATDPWRLLLYQRPKSGDWREPVAILEAGVKGYVWLGNVLSVSADGALHLAFCIYDTPSARSRYAGYLCSSDGGKTWQSAEGRNLTLPITPDSDCYFENSPDLDVRVRSAVVDGRGHPWILALHLEITPRTVLLWNYNKEWKSMDLLPHLQSTMPGYEIVDGTLAFDEKNRLHVLCTVEQALAAEEKWWGHPANEVVLFMSEDDGKSFQVIPISKPDEMKPNWLPSIERPFSQKRIGLPSLLFTRGGPGEGGTGGPATEVVFVRLGEKKEVKNQ